MNLALINIRQLVTVPAQGKRVKTGSSMRELGIIENAAVLVHDNLIHWVGKMEDLSMKNVHEADILDCLDRVVMPGFVDSHTHLLFAGSREDEFAMRSAGASYEDIARQGGGILSTMKRVREASKKELKKAARHRLTGMMKLGTTTVEIKSGYGLEMDAEVKMLEAINELNAEEVTTVVPTFLGAHAVPPEFADKKEEYVRLITEKMIPYVGGKKLARFCDVFCERGYFELGETHAILSAARQHGLAPKIHAEQLSASRSAELAGAVEAVSADHLEHINVKGIEVMAERGVVATLLPGVSFFLNQPHAPARQIIDAGVPVAIATDFNPGSCMSYSMPLMMTIACAQMHMTPEEVITASTLNAAAALNLSGELGSIETGKKADLIVLEIPNYKFLPYHFGENHVTKVVKDGVVLEL